MDETKQTCSLKNKGKFEINFNFAFESTDGSPVDVAQLFTVIPNRGPLLPTDRPTQVQVIFRSKSEITIKDQPILKCQVKNIFRIDKDEIFICHERGTKKNPESPTGIKPMTSQSLPVAPSENDKFIVNLSFALCLDPRLYGSVTNVDVSNNV